MTVTDAPDFAAMLFAWRPRWYDDALCRGVDPDLFFPGRGEAAHIPAKAVCASCPVRQQCLDFAIDSPEHFGIWGGTSERERRGLRRRRKAGRT